MVRGARRQFAFLKYDISVTWRVKATKTEERTEGAQADRQDAPSKGLADPLEADVPTHHKVL